MDARRQATHDALYQIDPELAGLFARGCELVERLDEPGVRYLIGHIGRELSKAVLDVIARELPPVVDDSTPAAAVQDKRQTRADLARVLKLDAQDSRLDTILNLFNEGHRDTIARALNLGRDHPLVRSWLRLQRDLVASTHYRKGASPPSAARVREAFTTLAGLLFTRVGPYFHAQDELDALLEVTDPNQDDVASLRELLVRPQLRFRFFRELQNARWLKPLQEGGTFDHPPEWLPTGDGGYRMVGWPEGDCLVRLADQEPELAVEAFLRVPRNLQNPAVWQVVARAAVALPVPHARRLVPLLESVVRLSHSRFFTRSIMEAASRLATVGDRSAFRLANALLGLKAPLRDKGPEETGWARRRSEDVLTSVDLSELGRFLSSTIVILAGLDGVKTWRLLLQRLRRVRRLLREAGFQDDSMSQHWCESLESVDHDDDVRAQLAVAAMSVARRILEADPNQVTALLASLAEEDEAGLFARMRIALLVGFGTSAPDEVNREIASPDILDPPYGARESSLLLRTRFESASDEARAAFVCSLEAGPADEELCRIAEWQGNDPETLQAQREALEHWQRRRLRWFHDRIPQELAALAEQLGVRAEKPSARDQALDEVGFYSSGAFARGEISPKRLEDLRDLSDADLIALLEAWRPDGAASINAPSRRGLAEVLASLTAENPGARANLFELAATHETMHPAYRQAFLEGLRKAANSELVVPWAEAIELAAGTLAAAELAAAGTGREEWIWARDEAIDFLQESCTDDRVPGSFRERIFEIVSVAVSASPRWHKDFPAELRKFGDVILGTLNSEAGKTTRLLIAVALWAYRAAPTSAPDLVKHVRPWLELARTRTDGGRIAARAQLGAFLPQALLVDPDWVLANAEDLLGSGMADPLANPTWGGYVTMGRLHPDSFAKLRPWFGRHAAATADLVASEAAAEERDREWQMSRHYLDKVGEAYLQGWIAFGEGDQVLELVFGAAHPEDRAHFYWEVFRGWSDADQPPPEEFVDRLLRLWEWRLGVLEPMPVSAELAEEADGFGWLILTPHLPSAAVLPLALRSVRLAPSKRDTRRLIWPRLLELGPLNLSAVIEMAEHLITSELADQWPHFDFDQVGPVLRLGLGSSDAALERRTEQLVHRLGDTGWTEFGQLLEPN